MQDYFLKPMKLHLIDLFMKIFSASDCTDDEKQLAIQWVSELTDELMRKVRSHEYSRMMHASD